MMTRGGGSNKGRIRPPRRFMKPPTAVAKNNNSSSPYWDILKSALVDILNKNCSVLSYEEVYRTSYNLVIKNQSRELYSNVKEFEEKWLIENMVPRVRKLFYERNTLTIALGDGSVAERVQAGEDLLRGLRDLWEDHRVSMNLTTDVLLYLERNPVADMNQPGIWMTTIGLFRDNILKAAIGPDPAVPCQATVMDVLGNVIYNLVQMEREGHLIDHNLIRSNVYMLEGLWETDSDEDSNGKIYLTMFEPKFLLRSRAYFQQECARMLREGDTSSWIWYTKAALEAEEMRCNTTLSQLTREKIAGVVQDMMIRQHLADFVALEATGLRFMIHNDRQDDLRMLYQLAMLVGMRDVLTKVLASHIFALGLEIEKQVLASLNAEIAADKADKGEKSDKAGDKTSPLTAAAIRWIEEVRSLLDMFEGLLERCFSNDSVIQTSISKAFSSFIERFARASEFMSLYVDDNLKRGIRGKTEPEVDRFISNAISVIRYIPDKDLFERYYQKHLARRLLYGKSENHDVEKEMIARMKQEMGNQFTSRFEGMFKDLATSQDLTEQYRERSREFTPIDMSVSILTSNCWPPEIAKASEQSTVVYPPEIARLHESVEAFYLGSRSGRKLQWVDGNGSADIKCNFPAIPGKTGPMARERWYEINVTVYGMIVLLAFNNVPDSAPPLSIEEIQQRTGISQRELVRTLGILSIPPKSRVLLKIPLSRSVQAGDMFAFNKEFVSKSIKIRAAMANSASKVEDTAQRKDTEEATAKTRAYVVDAAVVRIMKQRKQLTHSALISEVVTQLASRFKPDIGMIKKRIEDLMVREYLERVEGSEPAAYVYVS